MPPALGLLLGLSLAGALQPGLEPPTYPSTEEGAILFATDYNSTAEQVLSKSVSASWNYYTNLTTENAALQVGGGTGGGCHRGGVPRIGDPGGWGMVGTLGVVPFLLVGSYLSTPGGQTGAGTCSLRTTGCCPKFALGDALPQSVIPGPGPKSRLFLEVVASSQHLPLSLCPFPDPGQVSSVPVPAQCHHLPVPCQSPTASQCRGLLLWGRHREPKVCTSNRVARGPRLPLPVPMSPAHGDEASFGEAL